MKVSVSVNEGQDKLPKLYWLPKLHINFLSYCYQISCHKIMCMKRQIKIVLVNKNSGEVHSKLKCRGFRAMSLPTYDFSTLYTTLPHNLIKEKLLDLIERNFKRALMVHFIWPVMTESLFSLPLTKVDILFCHVRMYATPYPISWIIFILDLEPSYTENCLNSEGYKLRPSCSRFIFILLRKRVHGFS